MNREVDKRNLDKDSGKKFLAPHSAVPDVIQDSW